MGNSVRLVILKFHDCLATAAATIGFARVAFSLRKREMAKRRHDLMSGRAGIREETAKGFAKAILVASLKKSHYAREAMLPCPR